MAKKRDRADKLDHEINSETWTCLECGRSMVPPSRQEIDEVVEGLQRVATIAKSGGAVVKVQGLVCVGCAKKRPPARRRTMKRHTSHARMRVLVPGSKRPPPSIHYRNR
jgi:hypothetical protein